MTQQPITAPSMSRRRFLKAGCFALGGTILACGGLGLVAARPPAVALPDPLTCGEPQTVNKKILVTYATRAGSTAGVAQAIGQVLCQHGAAVEVLPIKEVKDPGQYAAVIIGSAIRIGTWLGEATKFLETHQALLSSKPVAFFAVHLNNLGEEDAARAARSQYHAAARNLVAPRSEAWFAGVGDLSKLSFLDRMMAKAVKSPEGDFRDWKAIQTWADTLYQSGFSG